MLKHAWEHAPSNLASNAPKQRKAGRRKRKSKPMPPKAAGLSVAPHNGDADAQQRVAAGEESAHGACAAAQDDAGPRAKLEELSCEGQRRVANADKQAAQAAKGGWGRPKAVAVVGGFAEVKQIRQVNALPPPSSTTRCISRWRN